MMKPEGSKTGEVTFLQMYKGTLSGIQNVAEFDRLVEAVQNSMFAWEFAQNGTPVLMSKEEVRSKLEELCRITLAQPSKLLPYTYIKDKKNPQFIKLYNPASCGSSCSGYSLLPL